MNIILTAQLIISLFIILILYRQEDSLKHQSEKILFYYLILLMLRSFIELMSNNIEYISKVPYIIFINQSTYLLDAFFIYLYVKVLKQEKISNIKTLLLLLPFIIMSILSTRNALSYEKTELINQIIYLDQNQRSEWNSIEITYFILVIIYNLSIYIYSLFLFKSNSSALEKSISEKNDLSYSWQKMFMNSWFLLFFIPFIFAFISHYNGNNNRKIYFLIFSVCTLIMTFILGLKKINLKYEELKLSHEAVSLKKIININNKYGTLKLDTKKTTELKHKIAPLFLDREVILNSKLNLAWFSNLINEKPYVISQFINSTHNMSFQEYVNTLRINLSKEMLKKNPDYKIIHIALDCGYNSREIFNRQFKKITGITPSQFKSK